MKIKDSIYIGSGVIFIVIITILVFQEIKEVSDKLSLAGIIVNVLIAVVVVAYFQNKEGNSRSLKDYFITQVSEIKHDYDFFILRIKNGELNSNEIKRLFKDFSIKNEQLEYFLKNELKLHSIYVQKQNRKIHKLITNSYEFNNIYGNVNLTLENSTNNELINLHKEFNHHLTAIIVEINRI